MAENILELQERFINGRITEAELKGQVSPKDLRKIKSVKSKLDAVKRTSSSVGKQGFGGLLETVDKATGGLSDFEKAALGAANVLKGDVGGAVNALAKAFEKQATRVEELRIGLERIAVKDGGKFLLGLRKQQDQLMKFGVTLDTLVNTTKEFRENLNALVGRGFVNQEAAFNRLASVNERFGIGVSTSTDLINNLDKGFGMGGLAAEKFSRRLLKFARDTGQPFSKVFRDFNNNVKDFFVELDPDKALKKFTIFQQISRRFGTDIGQLTTMVDKFETLEEGAEFGGRLNMLLSNLGGSFDAVQATLMSQPERMEYIAGQVAQVGDRIRGMSDLGQRAVLRELAKTLGTDVGTIRALVNRDKGADLQRFLKGTSDLQAMGTAEQQKLAMNMTTRDELVKQTNDKLIGQIAVSTEALLKQATIGRQTLVRGAIDAIGEATSGGAKVIDRATKGLEGMNAELKTSLETFIQNLKGSPLTGNATITLTGDALSRPKIIGVPMSTKPAQAGVDNRSKQ
tara:strand:- start:5458 stop:6999 length:1542 start_codon:yes stop_codon:yes gene_type:complete